MHPRGRMFRYPQGRGGSGDVPPYDMGNNMPLTIGALASNLSNATPEQQRTVRESLKNQIERLVLLGL